MPQVLIGSLLLLAGIISVVAAILGNPIRLGSAAIPGPSGGPARAVVAGIGTAALAACAVVFILGPTDPATTGTGYQPPSPTDSAGAQAESGSIAGSLGGVPALTPTATATPSPKPPPAPSTTTAVPGKPTVTSISVSGGPTTGCAHSYQASVSVANGPVNLSYVIFVDDVQQGGTRTKTVSSSGTTLDAMPVEPHGPGKVSYHVLTPNPLAAQKAWASVPDNCLPEPVKEVSVRSVTQLDGPGLGESCDSKPITFEATLNVAPASGVDVTYHWEIDGVPGGTQTSLVADGGSVKGSVLLAADADGYNKPVRVVVTSPSTSTGDAVLTSACAPVDPGTGDGGGQASPAGSSTPPIFPEISISLPPEVI